MAYRWPENSWSVVAGSTTEAKPRRVLTQNQSNTLQLEEGTRKRGHVVGPGELGSGRSPSPPPVWSCWWEKWLGSSAPLPPLPCLLQGPGLGHHYTGNHFKPSRLVLTAASQVLTEGESFLFASSLWRNQCSGSSAALASHPPVWGATGAQYSNKHPPETVLGISASDWGLTAQSQ